MWCCHTVILYSISHSLTIYLFSLNIVCMHLFLKQGEFMTRAKQEALVSSHSTTLLMQVIPFRPFPWRGPTSCSVQLSVLCNRKVQSVTDGSQRSLKSTASFIYCPSNLRASTHLHFLRFILFIWFVTNCSGRTV